MYSISNHLYTLPKAIQDEFINDVKKLEFPYTDEEIEEMLNDRLVNMLDLSSETEAVGLTYEKYTALVSAYNWQ